MTTCQACDECSVPFTPARRRPVDPDTGRLGAVRCEFCLADEAAERAGLG